MPRVISVAAAALAALCACAPLASRAADFPIYPGVKRLSVPGMDENMTGAVLVTPDALRKVFDWYVSRLKSAGWTVQGSEFDASGPGFTIAASKGSPESQLIATLGGGKRDDKPGSQFTVMLIGPGAERSVFQRIAVEDRAPEEPEKPEEDEPRIGPTEEQLRAMETQMPPTPPNALQSAVVAYPKALDALLRATLNWANNTSRPNLTAALAAAPAYTRAADALRKASSAAMEGGAGAAFAGVMWSKQIIVDLTVGWIVMGLEQVRDRPALAARLQPMIKKQVRTLIDEDAATLRGAAREGERLAERAKQKDPGPTELDTVLTNEQIRATPETIYVPRVDLRVRSMWTPLPSYWKQVLKETATALRCWNAGCPDGCTVDDDGVTHCKAFGDYPNDPNATPADVHCLHILRTPEREMELLSHPMTLYCLLSLAVEVGDPAQLDAGGKLTVLVDDMELTSIPLERLKRPFHGNVNPYDVAPTPHASPIPAEQNIVDQLARATGILFGDDAERAYRATFRMPFAVAESAGGEFHGYTLFLQVGAPVGGSSVLSSPMSYGSAGFADYWKRLLQIAEKAHPALEKAHRITLRAEVGGIASDTVEVKLPAAFRSLSDSVGTFDAWPGIEPDKWEFDRDLGPTPPKAVPDHTVVNIGASKEQVQTNTRKLAMVYTWLIFQDWVKAVAMAGVDAVMGKIGTLLEDSSFKEAEKAVEKSPAWKNIMRKAVDTLDDKLTDVQDIPDSASGWLHSTIGEKLSDLGYNRVTNAFGQEFLDLAKEEQKKGVITLDLTRTGLRYAYQRQVAYHRRMIRHIGDTQLAFKSKVGSLTDKIGFARNLASVLSGGALKPLLVPVIAAEKGAAASLFVSDICAIKEIWYQVHMVERILAQGNSWMR